VPSVDPGFRSALRLGSVAVLPLLLFVGPAARTVGRSVTLAVARARLAGWLAISRPRRAPGVAAVLLGAANKARRLANVDIDPLRSFSEAHTAAVRAARQLGRYARAFARGTELDISDAVRLAHGADAAPPETKQPEANRTLTAAGWAGLTEREQEVALIVAEGLTNRKIADRLVISHRTVDAHVQRIMRKLGFTDRAQIVRLAVEIEGQDS